MKILTRLTVSMSLVVGLTASSIAQSDYDRDRFRYCKDYAQDISGYYGKVPNRYLPGGALEGALKGAATTSGLAWLGGANKKERKKAAKRGAAIGALIGAIKRGKAKDEQRRKKRMYQRELRMCMSQRD